MQDIRVEFDQIGQQIKAIENDLDRFNEQNLACQILLSIPGIGPINASAFIASIDHGQAFKNPKAFAVWLGLTPRQTASGERSRSSGITKRGDQTLRTQLIHGARTMLRWARKRDDLFSRWIKQLVARVGVNKAVVAIAHRLARLIWILLQKNEKFQCQVAAS